MSQNVSPKVQSQLDDNEQILWRSDTNVLPQVIAGIPGLLIYSGFIGLWSAGFFGGFSFFVFQSIAVAVGIGIIGFLLPVVGFTVSTIYESMNEEYVITDKKLITVTANRTNINVTSIPRQEIKEVAVEQGMIADFMNVGNIKFEVFQTDMKTDAVTLEGIDNPYKQVDELREILSEDLASKD